MISCGGIVHERLDPGPSATRYTGEEGEYAGGRIRAYQGIRQHDVLAVLCTWCWRSAGVYYLFTHGRLGVQVWA